MNIVLKIVGILIILDGIILLIKPGVVKTALSFFVKKKRIYLGAVLKAGFAVLFLFGASECKRPEIIIIIGIIGLFGAVGIVVLREKMKALLNFFINRGDIFWRLMSITYLAFGALVIYSV